VVPKANLRAALVGLERWLSSQGQCEKRLAFLETQQDGRVLRNREACVSLWSKNVGRKIIEKIDTFEWDSAFLSRPSKSVSKQTLGFMGCIYMCCIKKARPSWH
jgi:hypothetical protein